MIAPFHRKWQPLGLLIVAEQSREQHLCLEPLTLSGFWVFAMRAAMPLRAMRLQPSSKRCDPSESTLMSWNSPQSLTSTWTPVGLQPKAAGDAQVLNAILSDLMSRIWMTYRRGFPAIGEDS